MSYITVPAEKVRDAAQAIITRIEKRRNERNEKMIAVQMTKRTVQLKRPFITYFDRESAIEYLKEEGWDYPSMYAWEDYDKAKKLLVLSLNGDPVNISVDDAYLLWG